MSCQSHVNNEGSQYRIIYAINKSLGHNIGIVTQLILGLSSYAVTGRHMSYLEKTKEIIHTNGKTGNKLAS